jgi:hypothetical protein
MCLDVIDSATANFSLYNNDPSGIPNNAPLVLSHLFSLLALSKALSSLPSLSHSLGQVMLQGVATSHMASAEDGKSTIEVDARM